VRLHRTIAGDLRKLERVVIEVPEATKQRTADPHKFDPRNRETADHSLPCCVAIALVDGKLEASQFEQRRWEAAAVRALSAKIEVVGNDALARGTEGARPARLTAKTDDGRTFASEEAIPLGDAARPMDDDALVAKFRSLTCDRMTAEAVDRVLESVAALEQLADVRSLTRWLGKSSMRGQS
jgi:2-methylcitrate dehydratase